MSRKSIIRIVILFAFIIASHAVAAQEKTLTIGLIGDSTVASTYGWGPAFADQFNDQVTVLNYARNGGTLKYMSKMLDALIKRKPDYVLIQFGHNDMKLYGAKAYSAKLKVYVEKVTRSGSKAIVLSPVTRRIFDKNGKISPIIMSGDRSLPVFAQSARVIAKEKNVPFIDLNSISINHHNQIGPEASAEYNFNESDRTHFSRKGAQAIADLILKELKIVAPELAAYLK